MGGTTLCPFCNTRFNISAAQLEAYRGLMRCEHCTQAFDARTNYIPDQPVDTHAIAEAPQAVDQHTAVEDEEVTPLFKEEKPVKLLIQDVKQHNFRINSATGKTVASSAEAERGSGNKCRRWLTRTAAAFLLLLMMLQAVYFFRIDIAAHQPYLKPSLNGACRLLGCSVPLPQKSTLMSIESSDMAHDPANHMILNAQLRNHATYPQAYPQLELTLNDIQDKPLARRTFKPEDYLPSPENAQVGLLAGREFGVRLYLDTTDLKPAGYRLVLLYSRR